MSSVLSVPSTVTLLNVTSSVVPIACPIANVTLSPVTTRTVVVTPVPPSNSSVSVPG